MSYTTHYTAPKVYAQGFDLLKTTSVKEGWNLDFGDIAKIWRAGCIIRAIFLQDITKAYQNEPELEHLLFADVFIEQIAQRSCGWRSSVSNAAIHGVPVPAISSALSYFDSLRCGVLPANLLQAQRDYFGAHTYSRVDKPEDEKFHLTWSEPNKTQLTM